MSEHLMLNNAEWDDLQARINAEFGYSEPQQNATTAEQEAHLATHGAFRYADKPQAENGKYRMPVGLVGSKKLGGKVNPKANVLTAQEKANLVSNGPSEGGGDAKATKP